MQGTPFLDSPCSTTQVTAHGGHANACGSVVGIASLFDQGGLMLFLAVRLLYPCPKMSGHR
ncbi:hypothetical protein LX36DRAFT_654256 [Colletotrichum falcatum]|nr:hypothetical protein LX36DRAFT_654256 [Colletotrichum falcatum]